jgi:hypothetical protein
MPIEALINVLIASQAGLLGLFVWHLFKCRDTRVDIAKIHQSLERIEHEVGDHERGIRGELHRQTRILTEHEYRLKKIDGEDAR